MIAPCFFHILKYNRGRLVKQLWVFGLTAKEFNPPRTLFYVVLRRDQRTLHKLIRRHCLPGATIVSDCWRGYNNLGQLGYRHLTVNHTRNFVDPLTGQLIFTLSISCFH